MKRCNVPKEKPIHISQHRLGKKHRQVAKKRERERNKERKKSNK